MGGICLPAMCVCVHDMFKKIIINEWLVVCCCALQITCVDFILCVDDLLGKL